MKNGACFLDDNEVVSTPFKMHIPLVQSISTGETLVGITELQRKVKSLQWSLQ